MVRNFQALLLLFCLQVTASAQVLSNQRVTSTLSHQSIGLDETATLTITVRGANDVLDVSTPNVRPGGLQIVSVGRNFSMTSVNGVTETATQFNFLLTPLEKGRFVIDPVTVTANGVSHTTQSHRLEVTDAMSYSRNQPNTPANPWGINPQVSRFPGFTPPELPESDDIILEAELQPEVVYKHEASVHSLRLLAAVRLLRDPRYTPINPTGLIAVPMPQENSQEYRDGRGYAVTEAKTAFFPLTEGEYQFPPTEIDFSSGFFGQSQRLATQPITLKVLPLPTEGRPNSFTGAVGEEFEISAGLSRDEVEAGQTVELKVDTRGKGNLDLVPYPYLPNWEGVEKKQADGKSKVEVQDGAVISERSYVFRLKVKEPGTYQLDNIALAYFRPSQERYEVLKATPLTLTVLPSTGGEAELDENISTQLSEGERPAESPGQTLKTSGHINTSHFALSGLLAFLGLILAGSSLKRDRFLWSAGKWRTWSQPKSLGELELALSELAGGPDRLAREAELLEAGWKSAEISGFEALKTELASARYRGRGEESVDLKKLLQSYQDLLKQVKRK